MVIVRQQNVNRQLRTFISFGPGKLLFLLQHFVRRYQVETESIFTTEMKLEIEQL